MPSARQVATDITGILGAVILTFLLMPQIYTTLKTKTVKGLSLGTIILELALSTDYLIYGFLIDDIYIIIANCIATVLASFLLALYFKFKNNDNKDKPELNA